MKTLYYNPIEIPEKVRVISKCFGIDTEYDPVCSEGKPVYIDDLFDLAKSRAFDDVQVYFTSHEEAYIKPSKGSTDKRQVLGWFSLVGVANGGGYLDDKAPGKVKPYEGEECNK